MLNKLKIKHTKSELAFGIVSGTILGLHLDKNRRAGNKREVYKTLATILTLELAMQVKIYRRNRKIKK